MGSYLKYELLYNYCGSFICVINSLTSIIYIKKTDPYVNTNNWNAMGTTRKMGVGKQENYYQTSSNLI